MTRQEITEDYANMAGLSQPHQYSVWVRAACMHLMCVKDAMIGGSAYITDLRLLENVE